MVDENKINPWKEEINEETIKKFSSVYGTKSTAKVLSLLGKKKGFYEAINSEVGRELLKEVMIQMERLLPKIIERRAKDEELALYDAYQSIFDRWCIKISDYVKWKNKLLLKELHK